MILVDYVCNAMLCENEDCIVGDCKCSAADKVRCGYTFEDLFNHTDLQPEVHPTKICEKCGGRLVRGLNVKSNCQVWGVNKT